MNYAGADLFHGHPFELVMSLGNSPPLEAGQRASPKLFCALGRDIDKEKAARNGSRAFAVGSVAAVVVCIVLSHDLSEYTKQRLSATNQSARMKNSGPAYAGPA
jgi:hypothetical protein